MNSKALIVLIASLAIPTVASAEQSKLDRLVKFEPGRRRVYWNTRQELKSVARTVQATCPTATITVEGNAYIPEDEERSIALGQARADIVRELLVRNGFAAQSVQAIGVARGSLADGNGRHVDLVIDCPRSRS